MSHIASVLKTVFFLAAFPLCMGAGSALAQEKYPNRPIDVITPVGPGGGADQFARALAPLVGKALGVPLPVSNVTGAGGMAGLGQVATAKPDGYTVGVFMGQLSSGWASGSAPYKVDDFEWVARGKSVLSFLFVPQNSPFKTAKELLESAKAREVKVAIHGYGFIDGVTIRFMRDKGLKMTPVAYAKPGERYLAPLGGHVDVLYEEAGDIKQFLDSKQYRPLLVFARTRAKYYPDAPTSYELGQEVGFYNWQGIITTKGISPERLKTLSEAVRRAMSTPEWKKWCEQEFCEPDSFLGPEDFKKSVKEEFDIIARMVKSFKQ